jgi:hypothetical protein
MSCSGVYCVNASDPGDIVRELFVLQNFPVLLKVDNILLLVPNLSQSQAHIQGIVQNEFAHKSFPAPLKVDNILMTEQRRSRKQ